MNVQSIYNLTQASPLQKTPKATKPDFKGLAVFLFRRSYVQCWLFGCQRAAQPILGAGKPFCESVRNIEQTAAGDPGTVVVACFIPGGGRISIRYALLFKI